MPEANPDPLSEVVGVRFGARGPLSWFRAAGVKADAGSWVVASVNGDPTIGQVIVGRGQCVSFPSEPCALPGLIRAADAEEKPQPPRGAGQKLRDSLPL